MRCRSEVKSHILFLALQQYHQRSRAAGRGRGRVGAGGISHMWQSKVRKRQDEKKVNEALHRECRSCTISAPIRMKFQCLQSDSMGFLSFGNEQTKARQRSTVVSS